jgi:hypothetical protein
MSVIGLRWAYSLKLGNATAKSILAFLASHNFAGDQSCFKVKTIGLALDLGETAVKGGLQFLAQHGLIKKEARFGENGSRLSNEYTLNIPKEFIEKSYNDYGSHTIFPREIVDNSGGVGRQATGGGSASDGGVGRQATSLNNNKYNNNINKKLLSKSEQKKANEQKPSWAEPKPSPRADVTKQSTSWNAEEHNKKSNCSPETVEKAMMSLPRHMRPKKYRNADSNDIKTETAKLSTGTAIQSEIPSTSFTDGQGATIDARGCQDIPSDVRGSNGLLEARRVYSFIEEAGMASADGVHFDSQC